ncbi:hypothetical protein KP509_20G078200 [Ceratopteris richardii]|nr:hypothetical protein KP509_20G078200 [Ceratopteris richardii]
MELLASIKHRNLLAIKGFYANPVEKAIFYNYVANGTLYDVFHGPKISRDTRDDVLPDWALRQKIALGIAQAMAYLHRGCGYKILHRDLKSTNILLDADYNPRVSDFGLIHLVSGRAEPVETLGYTAPEVLSGKKHTEKGDVYSYGVVLLELLTGQRAVAYIGERAVKLAEWVMRLHDEGRGREVFDPIVVGTCQLPEQLDRYLNLAVLCIDVNPSNRPSMAEIANILETQCSSASPLRSPDCKANNPLLSG